MLTIKIEDTYVEYPDDVDIPMVLRSPLLNEGKGSYIFNFTLPATDAIKKVLDYYHRPGRHGDIKVSKKVAVEFGPLKYYGKAEISEADDDSYEISCPINSGDLSSLLKEATLKGLDLGGDRNILNTTVKISAKSPDEYTYSSYGPDPFEEIVPIAFTVIEENIPAGSMAADGRSATIADVGDAFINLDFKCEVILGIILFRLYADGVLTETVVLESNTKKLITLQNWSGVLTWDLLVQNGNAQEPGMFELDATVFSGSTISIRLNGMLGAYTEMYPNMDFVLFPFENPSMLANIPDDTYAADNFQMKDVYAKFFPVLNYYADDKFLVSMEGAAEGEYFSVFNLINPFVYLAYIIKAIATKFDFSIENNVFEDSELNRLVLFNLYADNNYVNADLAYIKDTINLVNHVPDVTISEFFDNLCKLLAIGYDYNSYTRVLTLKYLKDVASDTVYNTFAPKIIGKPRLIADILNGYKLSMEAGTSDAFISNYLKSLAGLNYKGTVYLPNELGGIVDPEVNDCYLVLFRKEYWYWNYDSELHLMNWIAYSGDFKLELKDVNTTISDKSFEVNSKMGTIMNNKYPFIDLSINAIKDGRQWVIPSTNQPGNFEGGKAFKTDYSLALLFYHGLVEDGNNMLYPFASYGNKDIAGSTVHTLALSWDGDAGLYAKRYKQWIDMLTCTRGTWRIYAPMSALELSQIDFFKWYTNGEYRFLIKEIRFNIKRDRLSVAQLDILIK